MIERYTDFIDKYLDIQKTQGNSDLEDLRNLIFAAVIKILIPLGFFIDVYNVFLAFDNGLYLIGVIDIAAYAIILLIVFLKRIPIKVRRASLLIIFELLAIMLIILLGQAGPGMIWLTGTTILATGIVGYKYGNRTLVINVIVLVGIGFNKSMSDLGIAFIEDGERLFWFIVVSNYVVINFASLFVMNRLLKGLEHNIDYMVRSEEQAKAMYSSINEAIIITDDEEKIIMMNYKASHLTGYHLEEAKGLLLENIYKVQRKDVHYKVGDKTFVQAVLTSKNKELFDIEETITDIGQHNIEKAQKVYIFRDMTEYNRVENEMRHMQKMQAVGQLASGIAHDFNNMLGGILGYAELIHRDSKDDLKIQRYSEVIIETTNRAADLTSQLLTFSRQNNRQNHVVNIHEALSSGLKLLERIMDPSVKVQTDFYPKDIMIIGDLTQIQNFILNLGINAKDAMPDGGTFKVQTQLIYIDAENKLLEKHKKESGLYVKLEISDEGIGMDQNTLSRMFEPFFTTKPIGKGTGLGLSAVYGAVEAHKGFIEVESEQDVGTTFRVYLPCLGSNELNTDFILNKSFTNED